MSLAQEIREIRLQVAENRLILGALLRSWERTANVTQEIPTPSAKPIRPVRRPDGTWVWPKSRHARGGGE
jgi:hypothetical protein